MIAITGSTGFIGTSLLKRLTREGIPIKALLRPTSRKIPEHEKAELVYGDIRDDAVLKKLVKGCRCLIHTANIYQNRVAGIFEMESINVSATDKLFRYAAAAGVKRIVYLSTAGIHRHVGGVIDETTPLRKDSKDPYERQKIVCEQILADIRRNHGPETVSVRPATVYGPGDERLKPFYNMICRGKFFYIGNGNNRVSWVYIDDLVKALAVATNHPAADGQAYLITGPDALSLRDVVATIADIQGVKRPTLSVPAMPFFMAAFFCEKVFPTFRIHPPLTRARLRFFTDSLRYSSQKIKTELNVQLNTQLRDGMERTLK